MNSNADSEDVLRVGGFYMLLDLTLTICYLMICNIRCSVLTFTEISCDKAIIFTRLLLIFVI